MTFDEVWFHDYYVTSEAWLCDTDTKPRQREETMSMPLL